MLRLFRDGVQSYQPEADGLAPECGDPQRSLENVQRILDAGLTVRDILVRPTGAFFIFSGGEEYYAPGLRVGLENPTQCEALAQIAARIKFGSYEDLLRHYRALPADYIGPLYPLIPEKALV
jgi:hypothetical protein